MSHSFSLQVEKDHYYRGYDNLQRFISYHYQIDLLLNLHPARVLEIGVGNKTVYNYLKQYGMDIDSCDFDKSLEPDYVADIRALPMKDSSYDTVMACEILEHLPWKDMPLALHELSRVSKKYVIISLPYSSLNFELFLSIPFWFLQKLCKRSFVDIFLRIPLFFKKFTFNGEHYWEMGRKGYSYASIKKELKKTFLIKNEIRPVMDPYHYFFVLEKK